MWWSWWSWYGLLSAACVSLHTRRRRMHLIGWQNTWEQAPGVPATPSPRQRRTLRHRGLKNGHSRPCGRSAKNAAKCGEKPISDVIRAACRNNVQISVCEPRRDKIDLRIVLHEENMKFVQKHPKTDTEHVSTVGPRRYGNIPEVISQKTWRIHLRVENRPQDPESTFSRRKT